MQKAYERLYQTLHNIVDMGRFSPAMIKIMADHIDMITTWIESKEFKETYAKHPYPPLINPKSIDYTQTPATLAWELNLPLPPYLKIVVLRSHGSGVTGLSAFLKKCGGEEIYCENFYGLDARDIYVDVYQKIINKAMEFSCGGGGNKFIYLLASDYGFRGEYQKYFASIPNIPAIHLVRDPISVLKSYLNYQRKVDTQTHFTLSCDPQVILQNRIGYGFYTEIKPYPVLDALPFWIFDKMMCFHDSLMIDSCVNLKEIYHLDMQETIGKNAYKNMHKVAHKFGFAIPKECDREFFERRVADFEFLLPITIYAHLKDVEALRDGFSNAMDSLGLSGGIPITITTCYAIQENTLDVTKVFFSDSIAPLVVLIESKDYQALTQNSRLMEAVCIYLGIFVQTVFQVKENEKKKCFREKDILEYFKTKKFFREKFWQFAEEHLRVLRKNRPQIIKTWKYYAQFLELCK